MKHSGSILVALAAAVAVGCAAAAPPADKPEAPPVPVTLGRADVADLASPFEGGGVVRTCSTAVIASRVKLVVAAPLPRSSAWLSDYGESLVRYCTIPILFVPETTQGASS